MTSCTSEYLVNLKAFSDPETIKKDYDKVGLIEIETNIVDQYFKRQTKILDLGCGTGRTSVPLQQKGFDVIGIDISEEMIEFAKQKHPGIDFRVMDASCMNFEDECFDHAFFSFNGLDCIFPHENRIRSLKEIYRVLKPGGYFVFSSHNALCLPYKKEIASIFYRNIRNFKILSRYRDEMSVTGKLIMYYGIPQLEIMKLHNLGFNLIEKKSPKYKNSFLITFFELTPYYILKKKNNNLSKYRTR